MTLSIKCIFQTLSINDIQHNDTQHNSTSKILPNAIMLSRRNLYIVMLSVVMLSVVAPMILSFISDKNYDYGSFGHNDKMTVHLQTFFYL
jgi:hypothetical protein